MPTINVPIGAATVEFGEGVDKVVFDITKGGITFSVSTSVQEVTVDQYGETPVKSIMKGRKAQVTVPFAVNDLEKLSKVMPNSAFVKSGDGSKMKLTVKSTAGYDMLSLAKKLVIKPLDPQATPNDWITIPKAGVITDPEYTYNNENERICKITFTAYPDMTTGELFIMGDETATGS